MNLKIPQLPLPWQQCQWQNLIRTTQQEKLPQALLLAGQAGLGKKLFAQSFAQLILCSQQSILETPCNQCKSCHLYQSQTHPDLKIVIPDDNSRSIKIDQIRDVITFMNQTSQQQGYKIVLIYPAERMNRSAANALLKTLEEPPGETSLWILVSDQATLLPATIRSRCQRVYFQSPSILDASKWLSENRPSLNNSSFYLKLCNNAPLAAATFYDEQFGVEVESLFNDLFSVVTNKNNVVAIAKKWSTMNESLLLNMLQIWLIQLIQKYYQVKDSGVKDSEENAFSHHKIKLQNSNPCKLFKILDFVVENKKYHYANLNINRQLFLESFCNQIRISLQ